MNSTTSTTLLALFGLKNALSHLLLLTLAGLAQRVED